MKKLLIMAAAVGLIFTSCTNDEEDLTLKNERKQITFAAPVMRGVTRVAGEMSNPYSKSESFVVFGTRCKTTTYTPLSHDPHFWTENDNFGSVFDNGFQKTTYTGVVAKYNDPNKTWLTERPYYYEDGYSYEFAAYSPARILAANSIVSDGTNSSANNVSVTSEGLNINAYEPGDLGKQVDLMYARTVNIDGKSPNNFGSTGGTTDNGNAKYNGINLTFNHALSSIHFKVGFKKEFQQIMEGAGYTEELKKFKIKSISITNVVNNGDFKEKPDDGINWILSKLGKNCSTLQFYNNSTGYVLYDHAGISTTAGETVDIQELVEGSATWGLKGTGLLIPQDLKEVTNGLGTGNNKQEAQIVIVWERPTDTATETVTTTINTTQAQISKWEMGKRYTYTLLFSRDVIYFAPTVDDWVDVNDADQTIYPVKPIV